MTTPTTKPRWYHLTPARFFIGLLVVQVLLFLSDRFDWFPFNAHKGWTVLIAVSVVCVAVLGVLVWGLVCVVLRWRFQFDVRSLLLFMVAVSVPLGWFAWETQKARKQGKAVETIVKAGGHVRHEYEFAPVHLYPFEPTTPAWLRTPLGIDFFERVVEVKCVDTEFNDNDARCLQNLPKHEVLDLSRTQIRDGGLAHLETLTNLKLLSLSGTQITDNGLAHLRGMSRLVSLSLDNTEITDNGLAHLKGLTRLEELLIYDTQVTSEGVKKLQEALPDCPIYHDHHP